MRSCSKITQVHPLRHAITFGVAYMLVPMALYCNQYIILCTSFGARIGKPTVTSFALTSVRLL
jgi:hypothetical protein